MPRHRTATWDNLKEYLKERIYIWNNHWLWTKGLNNSGYGVLQFDNKSHYAHRISYLIHNGLFDLSLNVLHKNQCNIKKCINPEHLYLGTDLDNVRDRIELIGISHIIINQIRLRSILGESQLSISKDLNI